MRERGGGWPWLLQRITALYLVMGLCVHFFVLHFLTERPVTIQKVFERLQSPGWFVFDALLLASAVYQALNGVFNIVADYQPGPKVRYGVGLTLWIIGLLTLTIGLRILGPMMKAA